MYLCIRLSISPNSPPPDVHAHLSISCMYNFSYVCKMLVPLTSSHTCKAVTQEAHKISTSIHAPWHTHMHTSSLAYVYHAMHTRSCGYMYVTNLSHPSYSSSRYPQTVCPTFLTSRYCGNQFKKLQRAHKDTDEQTNNQTDSKTYTLTHTYSESERDIFYLLHVHKGTPASPCPSGICMRITKTCVHVRITYTYASCVNTCKPMPIERTYTLR